MKPSRPITFESLCEESTRFIRDHQGDSVHPRSVILKLGVLVGQLCGSVLEHAPMDNSKIDFVANDDMCSAMGRLLFGLCVASRVANLDLRTAILNKMELNGRKYPVELCKGKSGKYTIYSEETGITKTHGQSTISPASKSKEEETDSIDGISTMIRGFAFERDWFKYHTPRSLVLALMGELGELAELFQWKGDGLEESLVEGFSEKDRDHVSQEFADVTIYLLRLADVCCVDIGKEALHYATQQRLD